MSKPKVIRKVIRIYKSGPKKGEPKVARDRKSVVTLEQVRAQREWECDGACIWGGTIVTGTFMARVTSPLDRRSIGARHVPMEKNYHFSCLPQRAMHLRRFFEPLPYRISLCLNSTEPVSRGRLFASTEEWEAWMRTHYPSMEKLWSGGAENWRQHGMNYSWCRIDRRT